MHQTLYIDIDEEITSVVERLRKAQAKEIVMVVPKRAMLIQSIVNLRLLKKEADGLGLQLMIVTQDKLGKLLVEKAGILVQQKIDDSLEEEVVPHKEESPGSSNWGNAGLSPENSQKLVGKNRLDKIGSTDYFDENAARQSQSVKPVGAAQVFEDKSPERIVNKELVVGIGRDIRKKGTFLSASRPISLDAAGTPPERESSDPGSGFDFPEKGGGNRMMPREASGYMIPHDKIESFFHRGNNENLNGPIVSGAKEMDRPKKTKSSGAFKKIIWALVVILILGVLGSSAYYFIPQANIVLTVKEQIKEQDCNVTANVDASSLDYDKEVIPAKLVSVDDQITQTFPLSGKGAASNSSQKAHGTITIYNAFSSSPQPLVATTRFVSDGGKTFRLVKAVTVPGTSKSGDQVNPGTIDAEVMADQAGGDYNIAASKFTIPGFQNNTDKFSKIYGQSTQAMAGGGDTGGGASGAQDSRAITDADVSSAKTQIQKALADAINKKIKDSAGDGMTVSDDAISTDEATYKLSSSVGDTASSFDITASTKASALAFNEQDLKNMVGSIIAKSNGGSIKPDPNAISLEYGKLLPDFKGNTLDIKVHGVAQGQTNLNMDKFKGEILGKSNDDFETYLSSYPDIQKAEVTYWPPFISSKIPMNIKRVNVALAP